MLFVYLLMDEIEYFPDGGMISLNDPRPKSYYEKKIYLIVMILNCICGVLKILGGLSSLYYRGVIVDIRETCIQSIKIVLKEREEALLNDEEANKNSMNELKSGVASVIVDKPAKETKAEINPTTGIVDK